MYYHEEIDHQSPSPPLFQNCAFGPSLSEFAWIHPSCSPKGFLILPSDNAVLIIFYGVYRISLILRAYINM